MPATLKANVKAIRDGHGMIYCYQVTGAVNPLASSHFMVESGRDRDRNRRAAYRKACKLRDEINRP